MSRTIPNLLEDNDTLPELEAVTINSPLGRAVLGHTKGEKVEYRVDNRTIEVGILAVKQFDLRFFRTN